MNKKIISYFFLLVEKLIEKVTPTPLTYNPNNFAFINDLKKNRETILREYEKIKLAKFNEISPETAPDKYFKNSNWNVFILFSYGKIFDTNIKQCPVTYSILKKYSYLKTAMFSLLPPKSKMEPHRGPYKGVIRCLFKLKLEDREGDVGLQILDKKFNWKNNDVIIFDDTLTHSAWNLSTGDRVVLFLDIERPLPFPVNILNKFVIFLINKNKRIKQIYQYYKKENNFKD